jgi:AraC-like DNA-binding protein
LKGTVWVELATGERERLEMGDYVIVPNGTGHNLSAEPGVSPIGHDIIPADNFAPDLWGQSDGAGDTQLLCGYFQLSESTPIVVLKRLPALMVHRRKTDAQSKKIETILQLVRNELLEKSYQMPNVLNRLSEILCLHAIDCWLHREIPDDAQLSGLFNPKFQLVLEQIQIDPSALWTVETLAEVFGQSRTTFATHFKSIMGIGPITYVTRHRMQLAVQMLEDSVLSLDDIAEKTGYSDTNAFNRAFKRETGVSPGAFRQRRQSSFRA